MLKAFYMFLLLSKTFFFPLCSKFGGESVHLNFGKMYGKCVIPELSLKTVNIVSIITNI